MRTCHRQLLLVACAVLVLSGSLSRHSSVCAAASAQQAAGIPVCPPGFAACGMAGCYSSLMHRCQPDVGCLAIGLLAQVSNFGAGLARQVGLAAGAANSSSSSSSNDAGASAATRPSACPVRFINTCGAQEFCGTNQVCVNHKCSSGSTPLVTFSAYAGVDPALSAQAACAAARQTIGACAADASALVPADCNAAGVAGLQSISCFQSDAFVCAAAPGTAAHFACRGIAGVAQVVNTAVNTTLSTAALLSAAAQNVLLKEQQLEQQLQARQPQQDKQGHLGATVRLASLTADGASRTAPPGEQGGGWRQPLLQPLLENLAARVSEASKSLFNVTIGSGGLVPEMGSGQQQQQHGVSAMQQLLQRRAAGASVVDLGPPPIKDASSQPMVGKVVLLGAAAAAVLTAGLI